MLIQIPDIHMYLGENNIVKLHRFDTEQWIIKYGWYAWGGNRPVCGWYLVNTSDSSIIKPLQKTDIDDIYLIKTRFESSVV